MGLVRETTVYKMCVTVVPFLVTCLGWAIGFHFHQRSVCYYYFFTLCFFIFILFLFCFFSLFFLFLFKIPYEFFVLRPKPTHISHFYSFHLRFIFFLILHVFLLILFCFASTSLNFVILFLHLQTNEHRPTCSHTQNLHVAYGFLAVDHCTVQQYIEFLCEFLRFGCVVQFFFIFSLHFIAFAFNSVSSVFLFFFVCACRFFRLLLFHSFRDSYVIRIYVL